MGAMDLYREWDERVRNEGRLEELRRLYGKQLGRALTEAEQEVLSERFARLGLSRLEDVVLELKGPALAAWLIDPTGA